MVVRLLHRRRRPAGTSTGKILAVLIVVGGAAAAVLTGIDGSIGWQAVRVALVAALTVVAVLGVRRADGRWRGLIACTVGLVAVSAGLGIGGGHLLKTDLGIVLAAGLVLLVAGLALFTVGAVEL